MKKNYFVKSIIFSFVLLSVIIFSCDKKNIIEDDLNVCIKSFELLNSENEGKNLGSNIDCEIDAENYTISLTVPHTAVLDGLKFNITPCEGTTISPASGEEINFEEVVEESIEEQATTEGADEKTTKKPSPQRYKKVFTVTKDGKSQDYTVYITKALASDCSISSFKLEKSKNETKIFGDREGQITEADEANTITLHISDAATLDEALNPTIIHTGASISSGELISTTADSAGTSITTTTVNYTLTAADGKTTKVYVVKYIKDLSSNNIISVFSFTKDTSNNSNTGLKLTRSSTVVESRAANITISDDDGTIKVKASTAATITALIPTITKHERATISPEIAPHDYNTNNNKVYTVTAEDGQTKEYTVSVTKNLSNDKSMTSFTFKHSVNTDKGFGSTDYSAGTITTPTGDEDVTVTIAKIPVSITDLNGLKPTIDISAGAIVSPASLAPQNFTRGTAVDYTVTAQDGTTRKYKVTIGELSAATDITSFTIKQADHTSLSSKITADMTISPTNSGSDYTIVLDGEDQTTVSLSPEIVVSPGATVDPASKVETEFTYGTAKTYTVTAENGTTKAYSVIVKSSNSKMKSFKFKTDTGKKIVQDVEGVIRDNTITVKVPHDAVVTALTPEVLGNNGSKVTIKGQETDANTEQNFSSSKTYTVTAQDGTTSDYTVTVTPNAEPQIQNFIFAIASPNNNKNLGNNPITGTITHNSGDTPGEIIVKVPHDAEIGELTPTVTTSSGATVYKGTATEAANTPNNFDNSHSTPKEYSVVDSAGGRKVYEVKVYKEPAITEFKFEKNKNTDAGFPTNPTYYTASAITQGTLSTNGTIAITVANTVDVTKLLKASISGNNINSSTTIIDITFDSPPSSGSTYSKTITVQNEHLSDFTKTYTVNLTKEAAPQLTSFKIGAKPEKGIAAEVDAALTHPTDGGNTGTIKLKFPYNVANHSTDIVLTGLTPTIEPNNNGYTVSPTSGQEISGDISSESHKTFTLTTALGSTSKYTVTAVKGPYISSFKFAVADSSSGTNTGITTEVVGTINHEDNTIKLVVPKEVSESPIQLTPTIEVGGDSATVDPTSGTSKEFTVDESTTVDYTVTGAESMTKVYKVTVTKASS
ncbi:DUF5018 domain-containing protein [Ichthyobacterium seriolicida]|uniref:Pkd domain containing protein n=1 Tax=Ichthyobacterium seriolicida TaxID=242600 RepID=A0A1J1E5P6_9FLAO|nr:hypothetical protein [Ichthyobacterium seriolicida]BAV94638.1 pkd domain containing protein [Ichthyobacterium seriolicida]